MPLVRTLQAAWPQTRLSWVIGKLEQQLVGDLPGIEFIRFDKSRGRAAFADVRQAVAGRRFDVLLQMQVALRSNLLSLLLPARRRIGYDRARSRDGHGLVIRERIPDRNGEHVLDAIGSFCEPLGLRQETVRWDLPIPDEALAWAADQWQADAPVLMISPGSSHALRNWLPERYAAVADHATGRGWQVVLTGGRSPAERQLADAIIHHSRRPLLDLTGKDTLKKALAMLQRADLLLTPDSGPMHMANAVGTRVLGLHAASNPDRSGPYSDRRWCVNRYDQAARRFLDRPAAELAWGTKIEKPGVMALISIDDVLERFEAAAADRGLA